MRTVEIRTGQIVRAEDGDVLLERTARVHRRAGGLVSEPVRGYRTCGWEIAVEHYVAILCRRPAIVVVDRAEYGTIALCREHVNDPEIYRDVVANGWSWQVVESRRDP